MGFSASLPLRECGLKYVLLVDAIITLVSLPLRECGLKLLIDWFYYITYRVTPFAGVWIEICHTAFPGNHDLCHSLCGSVDWNPKFILPPIIVYVCHSLCGSVDWNRFPPARTYQDSGHSLCGSVDWNRKMHMNIYGYPLSLPLRECGLKYQPKGRYWGVEPCHSLCGSVDWNRSQCHSAADRVTPFAGVWIEIQNYVHPRSVIRVTPFAGVWIEIPKLRTLS